jgi:hypothetical protein
MAGQLVQYLTESLRAAHAGILAPAAVTAAPPCEGIFQAGNTRVGGTHLRKCARGDPFCAVAALVITTVMPVASKPLAARATANAAGCLLSTGIASNRAL